MPRSIPLTKGRVAIVDDGDYAWLTQWRWRLNSKGYAIRSFTINGKEIVLCMHREIMQAQRGQFVDHIDHNRLNNGRANLRFVTQQQNLMNRRLHRNNSSGQKGVSRLHDKWHARIQLNEQSIHLGFFDDLETAAQVYDVAARKLFGIYAMLNLPDRPTAPEIEALVVAALARKNRG
jgi:hypothetical protein